MIRRALKETDNAVEEQAVRQLENTAHVAEGDPREHSEVTMMAVVGSIGFWTFIFFSSVVLFPIACLIRITTSPFDRRLTLLHRFTSWWGSLYIWVNPLWKVQIEGERNLPHKGAYVIVSNHQSLVDVFVLFRLPIHYKWVSKIENFRIPLIGWNMTLNRYIAIDRGSMKGNLKMMRDCERALRRGNSIMIFPEGTRSVDGTLREFKGGAFELALMTEKPILPILVDGSANALPRKGFVLRGKHLVRVRILAPIPYGDFAGGDASALKQHVFQLMQDELARLRDQTPGSLSTGGSACLSSTL